MPDEKVHERRLQRIGQSLLVTLPKPWVDAFRLRKGATVRMLVSERGSLTISPGFVERAAPGPIVVPYDTTFQRAFFRAYFAGPTTIRIRFPSNAKATDRRAVHEFLRQFLNIHVTEENTTHIVVSCFRIEDLGIETCLRRMHLLSLSMIDESVAGRDRATIDDMERSLTQHYYLLVLLIRRFLTDGEYTKGDTLTLVRAMDMRMVAEKIERIADIIKKAQRMDRADLRAFRGWYATAFTAFINERFEDAARLSGTAKRGEDSTLERMREQARGIAMLVR